MGIYEWEEKFDAWSFPRDKDFRIVATGDKDPRLWLMQSFIARDHALSLYPS